MIRFNQLSQYKSYLGVQGNLSDRIITLCTDSRSYQSESAFLAITGEKFNAFEFISEMIDEGCKNIIFTKHPANELLFKKYISQFPRINFIQVSCSILFLQEHAKKIAVKFQQKGNKLICISGSNGKTTTKEMLYHLLESSGCNVIKTQKNNNNHIGVPLTLLQINEATEFAVIELGSNHPGEIKVLCEIADPNIGVVTNIGLTHMEFFPTIGDVLVEEGYLYHYIMNQKKPNKLFFHNYDDDLLKTLEVTKDCIVYSRDYGDFHFEVDSQSAKITHQGVAYEIYNPNITGKHNFCNLCVSVAIAYKVSELDMERVCNAAQEFKPTSNRSEWIEIEGCQVFLDAYNANPTSMEAAVIGFRDFLLKKGADFNKACVILGDMNELGNDSALYHQQLGTFITEQNFGETIFIGRFAQDYLSGVALSDQLEIKTYNSTKEFKDIFQSTVLKDCKYIFIKGSRSLQLEALVDIT